MLKLFTLFAFIIAICEIITTINNVLIFRLYLKHFNLDVERYNYFKAQVLKRELEEK